MKVGEWVVGVTKGGVGRAATGTLLLCVCFAVLSELGVEWSGAEDAESDRATKIRVKVMEI